MVSTRIVQCYFAFLFCSTVCGAYDPLNTRAHKIRRPFRTPLSSQTSRLPLPTNAAECEALRDSDSCKSKTCIWDKCERYYERCYFVELSKGNENSPCIEQAPDYVDLSISTPKCASFSQNKCTKNVKCIWEEAYYYCGADVFLALYGFAETEYDEVADMVMPVWIDYWVDQFVLDFSIFEPDVDWEATLEWSVPKGPCPPNEDRVCDFLYASVSPLIPTQFYCGFKYDSSEKAAACDADSHCVFDPKLQGCLADISDEEVAAIGFRETLSFIEKKLDRKIVENLANCYEIASKDSCKDKCMWAPYSNSCTLRQSWANKKVATADEKGGDSLCSYFGLLADSGCVDIYNPSDCDAKRECSWRTVDAECLLSADLLISVGATVDPSLVGELNKLQQKCGAITDKKSCNKA